MRVQWLVDPSEFDMEEFPPTAKHIGYQEVGPAHYAEVIEEECLGLTWDPENGVSIQTSDGGWSEPTTTAFKVLP